MSAMTEQRLGVIEYNYEEFHPLQYNSAIKELVAEVRRSQAEERRLRECINETNMHDDSCSIVFKKPCDCGFEAWKRTTLGE